MVGELDKPIYPINWWLIHGHARSGTSYLTRMIARCARRCISDWGLRPTLTAIATNRHARIDKRRALADYCFNLMENSLGEGSGTQLELVFKQASLKRDEFELLVQMWGTPARKICCFREPAGTINSHLKKFPHFSVATAQARYLAQVELYEHIGGELFEYNAHLTVDDYRAFLSPLILPDQVAPFDYKGNPDSTHVTPPMEQVYEHMRQIMARQQRAWEQD